MDHLTLIRVAALRESLKEFINPKVLRKIVDLCEALGTDRSSFISQYKFWSNKNGEDCRYAAMAKKFFLDDQAEGVAKEIIYLYHNFAKRYEEK